MAIIKGRPPTPKLRQLGWFVALWALSVVTLGIVGGAIKLMLRG